ncbi:MAG: hypothetical protein ABJO88_00035 [Parasphingorhabdus sp.]
MRRVDRAMRRAARLKTREGELTVGTFNICNLAFNAKNGLGSAQEIMEVCRQRGCDVAGLQVTRRDGQTGFTAARYTVYCSGAGGGGADAKGQHGVGLDIKESILKDVEKDRLVVGSTHEGATKIEQEIECDLLYGCIRFDYKR